MLRFPFLYSNVVPSSTHELRDWRMRILDGILRGIFVIWLFALAGGIFNVVETYHVEADRLENPLALAVSVIAVYIGVTAILAVITFNRKLHYDLRAGLFLFTLYVIGVVGLVLTSLSGDGRIFFFALIVLSAILFDLRASLIVLGGSLLTLTAIGWLQVTGVIVVPAERQINSMDGSAWVSGTIVFLALSIAALVSITYLLRTLEHSLEKSRETLSREQRLGGVLRTLSNVNQLIVRERDQMRLLRRICEILIEGRGYSFAWIGLLDADNVTLRLVASAGEEITAEQFALRLDDEKHGPVCAAESLRQRIPFYAGGSDPDACLTCPLLPRYPQRVSVTLPLLRANQAFGALTVVHATPAGRFDSEEVKLLTELADDLAYALENLDVAQENERLNIEMRVKAAELGRLYASLQEMTASLLDPPALLHSLAHHIADGLNATSSYMISVNQAEGTMTTLAEYWAEGAAEAERKSDMGVVFQISDYPTVMHAMFGGEVVTLQGDDPRLTEMERRQFMDYGIQSMLFIPIFSRGKLLGDMEIWESRRRREFTQSEIRLAQAMAAQASSIIENAQLFAETRRRESELATMLAVAQAVSSSLELKDVLKQAVTSMAGILNVDDCYLSEYDPETRAIVTSARYSRDGKVDYSPDEGFHYRLGDYPVSAQVMFSGIPVVIRADDPQADPAEVAYLRRYGYVKSLLLPLRVHDSPLGMAELCSFDPRREFKPEEIHLALALADQVAVAIDNARLYNQLEQREAHFRALIENSAEGVAILDAQGIIRYLAPSEERLTGFAVGENVGISAFTHIHPDDLPGLMEIFSEGASTPGAVRTASYRLQRKDGEWRYFEVTGHNMLDDPYIAGIVVNYRDITERKRAEEALLRQNQYLVALQTTTLGLIGRLDLLDLLENIVIRAGELVGTSHGAVLLVEPGETEMVLRVGIGIEKNYLGVRIRSGEGLSGKVWQTGMPMTVSDYHAWAGRKPDPSHDIFRASAAMPLTSGERVVGVIMLDYLEEGRIFGAGDMDILRQFAQLASVALENARLYEAAQKELAERKQAEEALRESRSRLEGIITTAINAIITVNEDQQVILFNPSAEKVFGWPASEIIGRHLSRLIPERYRGLHLEHVGRYSETGISNRSKGTMDSLVGLRANGEEFPMEAFISQNVVNGRKFFTVILQDITERRQAEENFQRHTAELEALTAVSTTLRAASNLAEMIPLITRHAAKAVHAARGSIFLLEAESGELVSSGWYEAEQDRDVLLDSESALRHRIGEGITGRVAQSGELYFTDDLQNDSVTVILPLEAERLRDIHSGLSLPLRAHDKVVGVLHVWLNERRVFTETEIRLLTAIAEMAGNAIHRTALFEKTLEQAEELALAYDNTLAGWARALELRDELTEGHTRRVTELTLQLARALNIPENELVHIRRGALLHDIGKMGIPDSILHKPGPFTAQERKIMQQHTQYAHDMLSSIPFLQAALDIPFCHHEHWNGEGYPRGLKGEEIPLSARIFSVVDVWDALTSDRPYRHAWSRKKTADYILERAGKQFDPRIVEAFFSLGIDRD